MLLEVPPRSPSPCFESPCLFLKVFLVRPLRPCYCSWADMRSPFSPPALLWFGGTALPPRAWAGGAEGQCRGHVCFPSAPTLTGVPNRAPPAPECSLLVLSPLWGLELPWEFGLCIFLISFCFLFCFPSPLPLPHPNPDSHLHPETDTCLYRSNYLPPVAEGRLNVPASQRGACDKCFSLWLGSSLSSWVARNSSGLKDEAGAWEVCRELRKICFN